MALCDILIVGSGVAGLSLAIRLNKEFPNRKIVIITKGSETESNTWLAQGGISAVCDTTHDSFESHIRDTINAGAGLCRKAVVKDVIERAPKALATLVENGTEFDRDSSGEFVLGREGGHSAARIVHYKDMTGFQIAISLLVKVKTLPNIEVLSHHLAVDLITDRQPKGQRAAASCVGAVVFDKKASTFENYIARVTVLACGGSGQVYKITTNPSVATGDGIAIAHRAGALIRNMEFIQFHPTAFVNNEDTSSYFLITEALRGSGAYLVNVEGKRFMYDYDAAGELACRDVVARAIVDQMSLTKHRCVYLDCRHLDPIKLKADFPKIYRHLAQKGIDIDQNLIPVIPAAHYTCGGIDVDRSAKTSIANLYALGECSHTGLHGANRLASNSLLEAVVFSDFCFQHIKTILESTSLRADLLENLTQYNIIETSCGISIIKAKIQALMSKHVGVTRTNYGLHYADRYLTLLSEKFEQVYTNCFSAEIAELRNIMDCAKLIVKQSLARKRNAGSFYCKDLERAYVIH